MTIRSASVVLLFCAMAAVPSCPVMAQSGFTGNNIRFGMTASVIETDVNPDDAMAAAVIWISTIGKGTGLWNNSVGRVYKDAAGLSRAVADGEADIVAMGTQEYLEVKDSLRATPTLTYVQAGQVEAQYLLLVRTHGEIQRLEDLRGKRIAMLRNGRHSISPMWLDVLLYENGLGRKESFFKEIKNVLKPSQTILPVFFNQMDAGIVLRSAYQTAIELNPQIGQQTKVLAASPKLVMLVVCLSSALSSAQKEHFVREAMQLHEKPTGLQTFNIFKLDRLVPWDPSYFNNVADLMKKQKLANAASPLQARSQAEVEAGK